MTTMPARPVDNEDPWFAKRDAWDAAVEAEVEGLDARGATLLSTANAYTDAQLPSVTGAFLGQINGVTVQPWRWPEVQDLEFWRVGNWRAGIGNNSTLTPSITANGTSQSVRTLMSVGNISNRDSSFRVKFRIVSMPTNGWGNISILAVDSGGNLHTPSKMQIVRTLQAPSGTLNREVEFDLNTYSLTTNGEMYIEIRLSVSNNATTGTMAIDNVSIRQISRSVPSMFYGFRAGIGFELYQPLWDARSKIWRASQTLLSTNGDLESINAYNTWRLFRDNHFDPDMVDATGDDISFIPSTAMLGNPGEFGRGMRVGNNDQIFAVLKSNGTSELRGNVHGGETPRTPTTGTNVRFEGSIHGDGTWKPFTTFGSDTEMYYARLFRARSNTQLARSAPDSDVFAHVDHDMSFYPDGLMRMDRTTTFQTDTRMEGLFEWMSSSDLAVPNVGRVGNGLFVQAEIDTFPKVSPPAVPTTATATTGGTLPAGTYRYLVTALGETGETTPSPYKTQDTTGSTSTVTVSWTAVANARGYRIYGRINGEGIQVLLNTVAAGVTSWIDTGAVIASGPMVPQVNTARLLSAASTDFDRVNSPSASWAVWYDPIVNVCFGNIYDRDAVAVRPGFLHSALRLERGDGIKKNYLNTFFDDDGLTAPVVNQEGARRTFPAGTAWTATHWAFTYVPANPDQYHEEIAVRGADLGELKQIYPSLWA